MQANSSSSTNRASEPLAYLSFDRFPSPKGAATHIDAFSRAIADRFGRLDLLTVAPIPEELESCEPIHSGIRHWPILASGAHLFERVHHFRVQSWRRLQELTEGGRQRFAIVHFRSIFEGYPIAKHKQDFARRLIYEVNGLPSIELKYHYPDVAEDLELLRKLRAQEQLCLEAADRIITVSQVNARHLISLGVDEAKIRVIPNGVDLELFRPRATPPEPVQDRPIRMLYCGGLTTWQGVSKAVEALALIHRDAPAELTVVGPARPRQRRALDNLAYDLGVYEFLTQTPSVSKPELAALHHQADVILAPLSRNDRNTKQGCSPLKVLEAMASGTPLVASDLEVVRELASPERDALLVRPGSGKAIKDAVFRLQNEPGLAVRLAAAARQRVASERDWRRAQSDLLSVYDELLEGDCPSDRGNRGADVANDLSCP